MRSAAFLHMYELSGSGSCLYVRFLAEALAEEGMDVHLVSSERRPEAFPWIREAFIWRPGQPKEQQLARRDPVGCVAHRLALDLHPVAYPRFEMAGLPTRRLVDMSDEELAAYVDEASEIVERLVAETRVQLLFVQHVLPMALVADRIRKKLGLPYVITVHGTDLEYAVHVQERYRRLALEALKGTSVVVALNADGERRVRDLDPTVQARIVQIPIGLPLDRWYPVARASRRDHFRSLLAWHGSSAAAGMPARARERLHLAVREERTPSEMREMLASIRSAYSPTSLDETACERLSGIDWEHDRIVFFLGKHVIDKGIHCLLAAFSQVLEEYPRAWLLVGGNGVFREGLDIFLSALDQGRLAWLEQMAPHLAQLDPSGTDLLPVIRSLTAARTPEQWARTGLRERVIFTGYLSREWLRRLLPLSDVSAISSIIPEALPLAAAEALAAGVPIVGPRQGGLTELLDEITRELPELPGGCAYPPEIDHVVGRLGERLCAVLRAHAPKKLRDDAGRRLNVFALRRFHVRDVARRITDVHCRVVG